MSVRWDVPGRAASMLIVAGVIGGTATLVMAQGAGGGTPKTPWGDPDLQGIWTSTDLVGVPLERPEQYGTRNVLTDEEFARRQSQVDRQSEEDLELFLEDGPPPTGGAGTGPPSHWLERGTAQRQASLIVDPPDGRMPPMTPDGQRRADERARRSSTGEGPFDGPIDLDYYDRCVSRGVLGSIAPVVYNNGTQIVQGPGYVAIRYEMIHETRVIPVDGAPALPSPIRQYVGQARGHWEGDTLVVETSNFNRPDAAPEPGCVEQPGALDAARHAIAKKRAGGSLPG